MMDKIMKFVKIGITRGTDWKTIGAKDSKGWKNKKGTCEKKCTCGHWKDHWEKYTWKKFKEQDCANEECSGKAEHGAHIYNFDLYKQKEWIVPFCAKCNLAAENTVFTLREKTIIVWANKGKTCEKS